MVLVDTLYDEQRGEVLERLWDEEGQAWFVSHGFMLREWPGVLTTEGESEVAFSWEAPGFQGDSDAAVCRGRALVNAWIGGKLVNELRANEPTRAAGDWLFPVFSRISMVVRESYLNQLWEEAHDVWVRRVRWLAANADEPGRYYAGPVEAIGDVVTAELGAMVTWESRQVGGRGPAHDAVAASPQLERLRWFWDEDVTEDALGELYSEACYQCFGAGQETPLRPIGLHRPENASLVEPFLRFLWGTTREDQRIFVDRLLRLHAWATNPQRSVAAAGGPHGDSGAGELAEADQLNYEYRRMAEYFASVLSETVALLQEASSEPPGLAEAASKAQYAWLYDARAKRYRVAFNGEEKPLWRYKGARIVAFLLASPGKEYRATDLMDLLWPAPPDPAHPAREGADSGEPAAGVPYQDLYDRRYIEDLKDALARCTAKLESLDLTAQQREEVEAERKWYSDVLNAGTDVRGNSKKMPGEVERCFGVIERDLRYFREVLSDRWPALAEHLSGALWCRGGKASYSPTVSVEWQTGVLPEE